jgi:hypothetical protein
MCRGSAHKIVTDSGTMLPKMPNISSQKLSYRILVIKGNSLQNLLSKEI